MQRYITLCNLVTISFLYYNYDIHHFTMYIGVGVGLIIIISIIILEFLCYIIIIILSCGGCELLIIAIILHIVI